MTRNKTLMALTIILTLPLSLCSFGISSFNDLPKKPSLEPSLKKPTARQRKAPKTAQEREEHAMLQTLDELAAIAEGLSKFTQSKETDEAAKTKVKIQENKQKEAEQRLKQQQSRGNAWKPSSGSYTPSRSGYGGGGYGGGYSGGRSYGGGGGSSPWSSSRSSSPWGSSSSGLSSSKSGRGGGSSSGFDYDEADETGKKKKDKKKKNKGASGAVVNEPRGNAEESYTKLVHSFKQGADLLEKALTVVVNKTDTTAAARALLESNQFTQLNKLVAILADIEKTDSKLQPDEMKKLESKKGNLLKQQQDRLNAGLKKIAHVTLIAATLHEDEKMMNTLLNQQNKAKAFLDLPEVQSLLTNKEINDRAAHLLSFWDKKNLKDLTTLRAKLTAEMKNNPITKTAPLAQQALATEFGKIKISIEEIGLKFPKLPEPIKKMLEKIDADLKKVDDLK